MPGTKAEALRPQALLEFGLPVAPARVEELPSPSPGAEALHLLTPGGNQLLLISTGGLALAFEATLYDLLAEARYPAPRPRRALGGGLIARLTAPSGAAAAACYAWPAGERLDPARATAPQLLEIGRLLARLHRLGEAHPASVPDPQDGPGLAARLPQTPAGVLLAAVLRATVPPLPAGALHGRLGPLQVLFIGDRVSAIVPSGLACSGAYTVDLAEAIAGWALGLAHPLPALRAIVSGYQALRRLSPEERAGLWRALRFAAARAGARSLLAGRDDEVLLPLEAADALGEAEVRAAAG